MRDGELAGGLTMGGVLDCHYGSEEVSLGDESTRTLATAEEIASWVAEEALLYMVLHFARVARNLTPQ